MAILKLTKRNIDTISLPESGQVLYWDTDLKGFMLRVTKGAMTFAVEARVNGKTVRTSLGLYGRLTPEQARKAATEVLASMTRGDNPNALRREERRKAITLEQAYQGYTTERTLRPSTQRDYLRAMDKAFNDWRHKPLTDITRLMVEKRFDELSEPTLDAAGQIVAKNEAFPNQAFRFLRALLNWASEKYAADDGEPLLSSNPCDRLKARKKWHKIERRDGWIRPDQLPAFFAALKHQPQHTERQKSVRDLCALYVLTGLRLSEGAALRWEDVDLQRRTITITSDRAKNHHKHELPVGTWLAAMLARYKQANDTRPAGERSAYVFAATNKAGHLKDFADVVESIAQAAGLVFTPHDLRRTFVTITNNHVKGLSAYTIKRLMNHSTDSADVTAGYIVLDAEALRDPMQQIEDFILRAGGVSSTAPVIDIRTGQRTA